MHDAAVSLLVIAAVASWTYLGLGSEVSPPRVLMFLAGYVLLGVAVANQHRIEAPPRRSGGADHLHRTRRPRT